MKEFLPQSGLAGTIGLYSYHFLRVTTCFPFTVPPPSLSATSPACRQVQLFTATQVLRPDNAQRTFDRRPHGLEWKPARPGAGSSQADSMMVCQAFFNRRLHFQPSVNLAFLISTTIIPAKAVHLLAKSDSGFRRNAFGYKFGAITSFRKRCQIIQSHEMHMLLRRTARLSDSCISASRLSSWDL